MATSSNVDRMSMIFACSVTALAQNQGLPSGPSVGATSQEPSTARPLLNFDVISLKPYKSSAPLSAGEYSANRIAASNIRGGPGTNSPERITATGITLQRLVAAAYGVLSDQVSGPGWISDAEYVLEAKVPSGSTKEQAKIMLQKALEERFELVFHHERKQFQIWARQIVRQPVKLKDASDSNEPAKMSGQARDGIRHDTFHGVRISKTDPNDSSVSLDSFLGLYLAATRTSSAGTLPTVVDMTGLTGEYDFELEYVGPAFIDRPDVFGPTLFSVLEKQLGLRLEQKRTMLDALVIDHAEKMPTDN